jgi:hypothetical protein
MMQLALLVRSLTAGVHDTCALTCAHLILHANKRHAMHALLSRIQSGGQQVLDMGGLTPLQLIKQVCSGVGTPQIKLLNEYFPETLGKVYWLLAASCEGAVRLGRLDFRSKTPHTLNTEKPDFGLQVIFINAPSGAGKVWHVAKVFVPHETRQKVTICGSR